MYNISFFLFYLSFLITTSSLSLQFVTFRIFVIFLSPPTPHPRVLYALRLLTTNRLIVQLLRERFFLRDRRIFAFSFVCFFFLFFFTRTSPEYTPPLYLPNYRSQCVTELFSSSSSSFFRFPFSLQ